MIKFLDLKGQYEEISFDIDTAISQVITESSFIGGETVSSFEREFAHYQNAQHCVGVGNGTDALEIAIEALRLPERSAIIVPANSFIASAEAVTRAGHELVFCDSDPVTGLLDMDHVRSLASPQVSALMAVHLHGRPCPMDEVLEVAGAHRWRVIEDAAQAHGAEWQGRRVGAIGDVGTFSFYPGKNLGAYGDGGAIVTEDDELASHCRKIANHGRIAKYDHEFEGRNSRLDGIQAAVLNVKLRRLDRWINRRGEIATRYLRGFDGLTELQVPPECERGRHSWHLFVVRTALRDKLRSFLSERGIQTGVHYPISLPNLPAYSRLRSSTVSVSADSDSSRVLSLPMGEHLSDYDVDRVIEAVRLFFSPRP